MSIIRGPRPESGWYTLDKRISEDGRLGWAARGLLVFLLGKPDNWSVSVAHLMTQTGGARIKTGRDGVYALLRELEDAGYLQRHQQQAGGRFGEIDYIVSEYPIQVPKEQVGLPLPAQAETVMPHTPQPDTAAPDTSPPCPANPPLINTDLNQGLIGTDKAADAKNGAAGQNGSAAKPAKPKAPKPADPPPLTIDDIVAEGVDRQHASDWFLVRKAKKAPLTQTAWDGVKSEAAKARITPAKAVQISAENNWQGFKAAWYQNVQNNKQGNHHGTSNSGRRESEAERVERINREHDERERASGMF